MTADGWVFEGDFQAEAFYFAHPDVWTAGQAKERLGSLDLDVVPEIRTCFYCGDDIPF